MNRHGPYFCALCCGGECRGGENLSCAQRQAKPSRLAGVLNIRGECRTVISNGCLTCHLFAGERLFIVPDFTIHEPVPWSRLPEMVRRAERHINWWVRTRNDLDHFGRVSLARLEQTGSVVIRR
jgi:hypothetical protein